MASHTGKILEVDLSTGTISTTQLEDDVIRNYIGGSGLAAKLFLDRVSPDVDPLSGDNIFFIMGGPLAGTLLPGSSRFTVSFKSPQTGIWGEACGGGDFAPTLKKAGYDGIAVTGKSDKPVYLSIVDDQVEIKDASDLWGKNVYETVDILKDRAEKKSSIVCIGQGGENLVKYAAVANGKDAFAGRTGGGAVMGCKKLKAISVTGTKKVEGASHDELKELRKELIAKINENIIAQSLQAMGTNMGMDVGCYMGDVPAKNYTMGDPTEMALKIGGGALTEKYLTSNHACQSCPIGCKRVVKVDDGPYKMDEGPGPEYETAATFGTLVMNDNLAAVLKLSEKVNQYGIDGISSGCSIAFGMECFEKGLITSDDLGGGQLRWGNIDDIFEMLDKIVFRKDMGDTLAEGVRAAAKKIGKGSEDFTAEVKGLEQPMHDGRALHGLGLAYAMGNRGACHVQQMTLQIESNWCAYPEVGLEGGYAGMESKGKAAMNIPCEDIGMLTNACVICQFNLVALSIEDLVKMMNVSTGFEYTIDELMKCGARIWILKRGLNNLMGVTAEDDRLTKRMLTPFTDGGAVGSVPDIEMMKKEYYTLRGLEADGKPSKAKLDELGLSDLAARL